MTNEIDLPSLLTSVKKAQHTAGAFSYPLRNGDLAKIEDVLEWLQNHPLIEKHGNTVTLERSEGSRTA